MRGAQGGCVAGWCMVDIDVGGEGGQVSAMMSGPLVGDGRTITRGCVRCYTLLHHPLLHTANNRPSLCLIPSFHSIITF